MKRIITIAGPCSAESESQLMRTAEALRHCRPDNSCKGPANSGEESDSPGGGPDYFRAGLWKPRTKPGSFEGFGVEAIPWMLKVKRECGLRICTEVANRQHVEACLDAGFDMLWIGARTTGNPFLVEELAQALEGTDTPVFVKNPATRDLVLWEGAIERLKRHGVRHIGLIHRGFPSLEESSYRNRPEWQAAVRMRSAYPELPLLCDPSHIAGDSKYVPEIAQQAMDLGLDGLMIECHCQPSAALSDAGQQLTPDEYARLLETLNVRSDDADDNDYRKQLILLRSRIDTFDDAILYALAQRMEASREIGRIKKEHNVSILQMSRWDEIMERAIREGREKGLPEEFIRAIFDEIHKASAESQKL